MNETNSHENQAVNSQGEAMFALCERLFPICRSITGEGFRQSLELLNAELGGIMKMHSIKSGTRVFDWLVPSEWNCKDAYIITPSGEKICDFKQNNVVSIKHLNNYLIYHNFVNFAKDSVDDTKFILFDFIQKTECVSLVSGISSREVMVA